jgi:signal recognition particle subunit SEC65
LSVPFWKIVRIIYLEYEKGKEKLLKMVREELMK